MRQEANTPLGMLPTRAGALTPDNQGSEAPWACCAPEPGLSHLTTGLGSPQGPEAQPTAFERRSFETQYSVSGAVRNRYLWFGSNEGPRCMCVDAIPRITGG